MLCCRDILAVSLQLQLSLLRSGPLFSDRVLQTVVSSPDCLWVHFFISLFFTPLKGEDCLVVREPLTVSGLPFSNKQFSVLKLTDR